MDFLPHFGILIYELAQATLLALAIVVAYQVSRAASQISTFYARKNKQDENEGQGAARTAEIEAAVRKALAEVRSGEPRRTDHGDMRIDIPDADELSQDGEADRLVVRPGNRVV